MTRRRRLLLAFGIAALLWLALINFIVFNARRPGQVSQFNAARITEGITLGEVEALLGGRGTGARTRNFLAGETARIWTDGGVEVVVVFTADGKAESAVMFDKRNDVGLWWRIRRALAL